MTNWDKVRKDWETSVITLAALAQKYDLKLGTLKSRKSRERWTRETDATTNEDATGKDAKDATRGKKVANKSTSKKKEKKKKASGNPNPVCKFPKRNRAAVTHGFFSKYIPADTLEIMDSIIEREPADLIWDQIQIQYAAIIRAQQLMYVKDQLDIAKELKRLKVENGVSGDGQAVQLPIEQEYELQFAWDRHANFMNAQSRAMSELRSLIKQFDNLAFEDDERRLKLDLMSEQISKLRRESEPDTSTEDKLSEYFDALGSVFNES